MAEQEDDLELKKRARRRLVGAVAFAVLAVALLPTVMDEEPPRVGADIAIRIPGQDEPRSAPLAATPERRQPAAVSAPAESPSGGAGAVEAKPEAIPAPKVEAPKAETAKPVESVKAPAKEVVSPAAEEGKRAQAILEGAAGDTEYVLLIGAYANQANVKALTAKLADLDIKTYTESVTLPQGKRTRVRAGPFSNRAAAESAREKMKRIGVNGQLAVRP